MIREAAKEVKIQHSASRLEKLHREQVTEVVKEKLTQEQDIAEINKQGFEKDGPYQSIILGKQPSASKPDFQFVKFTFQNA